MLSEAVDGTMMVSMMRTYSAEEVAAGRERFFNTHCLSVNNPDVEFSRRPTDIVQRSPQLFISCLETPTVYVVNDKSMELENIISTPEYPDFRPVRMMIFEASSRSAPTICEGGAVYNLASLEQEVLPHTAFTSNYSPVSHGSAGAYQVYYHLWDNEMQLVGFYNGYSNWFGEQFDPPYRGHTPIAMVDNMKATTFTMITRDGNGDYWQTTVGDTGSLYDANYTVIGVDIRENFKIGGTPDISSRTPFTSSPTYRGIYYAIGNKIYRKYFSDTTFPDTPWATIDAAGAEVTALAVSPDESQLYVGVQSGGDELNGHIYILNSQTGGQVDGSPYLNIGYKPVKIMYKAK